MKIRIAQLNPIVGAVEKNLNQMLAAIEFAQGTDILIFSEMVIPGYPPKDLLWYPEFVASCLQANERLIAAVPENMLVIWGNIDRNCSEVGKPLRNAAFCASGKTLVATAYKSHLPTYDVFDEARYFEPGDESQAVPIITYGGKSIAITVCEDLWSHPSMSLQEKAEITPILYDTCPLEGLKVDMLINLSASPYTQGKPRRRRDLLRTIARAQQGWVIYVNQVGANDDLIFDGHSTVTAPDGSQWHGDGFHPTSVTVDLAQWQPQETSPPKQYAEELEVIDALALGIADYVHKTGFQKVFIGLSGGIDSALTAALAQKALGSEHVIGVGMPGPYSSPESLEDAQALAENLKIDFRVHSIMESFQSYLNLLSQGERQMDLAEENLQSRLRGTLLMTLANRENALVLTTGNKSELATGYSTLYGDTCGALAPLGDVYKTWVYRLCEALNVTSIVIPLRTISKSPSAELRPNQKDTDSLPPYSELDAILKGFLEERLAIGDLLGLGYDEEDVFSTLRRIMVNEYKRKQMAPSLKVTNKAFGSGRIHPIVQQVGFIEQKQLV